MRRIVVFDRVSADGYFADRDGKLDWVIPDPEIEKAAMAASPKVDTFLFGHRTYQMFESFWPHVLEDPATAPDPHMPGRRSPELRAMAQSLNDATKLVFSRTRKEVTWNKSQIIRELDPRKIEELKQQPGNDMMIFGSGSIVAQLTEHGLIDEYRLIISPILLGNGKTFLPGLAKTVPLRLLETKQFPSGNIELRYARGQR